MVLVVIFAVTAFGISALTHVTLLGIVLGTAVTGWYYVYDVKRHPRVACRFCGGGGDKASRIRLPFSRRPAGLCGHCGGKKGVPRPALRLINGGERKKILAGIDSAKRAMKK